MEGVEITHILVVADLDRARTFYRNVLGATVYREHGDTSCVLQFLGSWLLLVRTRRSVREAMRSSHQRSWSFAAFSPRGAQPVFPGSGHMYLSRGFRNDRPLCRRDDYGEDSTVTPDGSCRHARWI